jgi:alpha-beta hydrolase superfamily lysophospholipase
MMFFLGRGYRVIAHDRRGHGRPAQVADGHDRDHYADVKPRVNKGRSRAASGLCSEPACYGHCYPAATCLASGPDKPDATLWPSSWTNTTAPTRKKSKPAACLPSHS